MKRSQYSAARDAWVCWAIASDTRIAYGSLVRRNASGRPLAAYQARTAARASGGSGAAGTAGWTGSGGTARG